MENRLTTVKLYPDQLENIRSILVEDAVVPGQYPYYELREWLDVYAGQSNWSWYYDVQSRLNIYFCDDKVAVFFKLVWG